MEKENKQENIQRGHRLEQINTDLYFLNKNIKDIEKTLNTSIVFLQQIKSKYPKQRKLNLRIEMLQRVYNSAIKLANQNKINMTIIDENNI